jgi:ABC-2 type transport system permease protein
VEQYGGTGRRLERRERRQTLAEPGSAGRERKAAWDVRLWPVASGVAWRTLKSVFTNPSLLLPSLLFPLFFFTAFAGGLSQVANVPGFDFPPGYTAFQFCFVLIQSAAFGGVFTGFGIARDFESGFARRLLLAAPNRSGIVLGYSLAALVRWVLTATMLTVVALIAGMNVFGGPLDVFGMYALALLINVAGLLWACGVAMRFRTIQAGPVMQMPVFLILFFAPVYVPLALLTGWIEAVATLNPLTYVLEAVRGLLAGDEVYVISSFSIALGLVSLFAVWSLRGLRKAEAAG